MKIAKLFVISLLIWVSISIGNQPIIMIYPYDKISYFGFKFDWKSTYRVTNIEGFKNS